MLKPEDKVNVFITTHYESLDSDSVESVEFAQAVERRFGDHPGYTLVEGDRATDFFCTYLGFDQISDDLTAVSAVLGFHEASSDADYFLQHWTSHFTRAQTVEMGELLVAALDEEIIERINQGWLDQDSPDAPR